MRADIVVLVVVRYLGRRSGKIIGTGTSHSKIGVVKILRAYTDKSVDTKCGL